MSGDGRQRRLSAILAADVAGYTQLVEQDTDGTVAAWQAARADVIDSAISEHSGRIVKHTGDGFLAEFPTVEDAVRCAIVMQEGLRTSPLDFRMGVNLGDVVDDGEDIHGEGVNIAARIEALADPGGISISGGVYDQVRNRINHDFEDTGEHEVKHVSRPVRVYRIVNAASKGTEIIRGELVDPGRPSIVILPFENLGGDSEQDFLADGLRVDIQNALVKVSGIFITAIGSANAQRGKSAINATRDMGVQFSLEGSVRRAGDKVRISVTLTNGDTGEIVWAEQFDRQVDDAFELLDEITGRVLTSLNVKLIAGEAAKVWHKTLKDLRSLEAFYRGMHAFFQMDQASMSEARRLFEIVSTLHPESSSGPTWVALTHWFDYQRSWTESRDESKRLAKEWAEKGAALPDADGQAQVVLCHLSLVDQNFDAAIAAGKKALSTRPNCNQTHSHFASVLHYCGDQEAALHHINLAMRHSPIHPPLFKDILANIYRAKGDYDQAAQMAKAAIAANPDDLIARLVLASIAICQNEPEIGASITKEICHLEPTFSVAQFAAGQPYRSEEFLAKFVAELLDAGLPE